MTAAVLLVGGPADRMLVTPQDPARVLVEVLVEVPIDDPAKATTVIEYRVERLAADTVGTYLVGTVDDGGRTEAIATARAIVILAQVGGWPR